ncbi:hypothetical protein [Metabacillus arenae]|uniref:Uncharacterized protein n=1 Tax=Metabacillus arenae TaxID=2771434 RepID=A0A926NL37_9BACI|nr:hypothetical protein [Metabacillus arenae]MBD1381953.1 hypothetical protein [Metabacillus arenae]
MGYVAPVTNYQYIQYANRMEKTLPNYTQFMKISSINLTRQYIEQQRKHDQYSLADIIISKKKKNKYQFQEGKGITFNEYV